MRKTYIHEILALSLLAVAACHQERIPGEEELGEIIRIEAAGSDAVTRAMLGRAELKKAGTTVKVYDQLTGFTGSIDGTAYEDADVLYIDDAVVLATDGSDDWNFASGHNWRWTRTGTHNFYGWLTKDGDNLTPANLPWTTSGSQPSMSGEILTVPSITFTKESKAAGMFDFSYSDKVNITGTPTNGTVELPLNHLFSALALTIQNSGDDAVNISSISLNGIKNRKSARVNYEGDSPVVSYPAASSEGSLIDSFTGTLASGTKVNLFNGQVITSSTTPNPDYILMWPQIPAELLGASFTIKYTYPGVMDPDDPTKPLEFEATMPLAKAGNFNPLTGEPGLEAGKKYVINLLFKGKTIDLTFRIIPWDFNKYDLDYSTNTIRANSDAAKEGVLWLYAEQEDGTWKEGIRDREITMESGRRVKGDFFIASPHSGQWQITTYPAEASQYFNITPSSGSIDDLYDEHGAFNGAVEFMITPVGTVTSQVVLHFNVDIELNGVWRNANSEFNRKDWKLYREP